MAVTPQKASELNKQYYSIEKIISKIEDRIDYCLMKEFNLLKIQGIIYVVIRASYFAPHVSVKKIVTIFEKHLREPYKEAGWKVEITENAIDVCSFDFRLVDGMEVKEEVVTREELIDLDEE